MIASEKRKRGRPIGAGNAERQAVADELAARVVANTRRIRAKCGITQEQLAERMGLSVSSVGHIEANTRPGLQTQTIVAIANALGVSIDELLAK